MATLTVGTFAANSSLGLTISPLTASSSNGDAFYNTGNEIVFFQNSSSQGGGSTVTVTVAGQKVDNFGGAASLHNVSVAIASSSFGLTALGPFRPSQFNDTNNLVQMTYSAAGLAVKVVNTAPQS